MGWLYFYTGYSFVDVWTLVHLSFWIFFGSSVWGLTNKHSNIPWFRTAVCGGCVLLSLLWEVVEGPLARANPTVWLDPESWWNSWLSDPLTCIIGVLGVWYLLDHRKRKLQ